MKAGIALAQLNQAVLHNICVGRDRGIYYLGVTHSADADQGTPNASNAGSHLSDPTATEANLWDINTAVPSNCPERAFPPLVDTKRHKSSLAVLIWLKPETGVF